LCGLRGQLHVIYDPDHAGIIDEQLHRFDDVAAGFVDRASLRVAATHAAHRRDPPARLVSFVSNPIGLHGFFNHPFPRQG